MAQNNSVFLVKEFVVPVYGSKVVFIVFKNTWRQVVKELKRLGFDTKGYNGWHFVHGLQADQHIGDRRVFAVILKHRKDIESTLVHELFHLTQAILEYKGVKFKYEDDNEAYAYLIGDLYKKTIGFVR
jgi:hypothetical protein